jgi:hypothetical protein
MALASSNRAQLAFLAEVTPGTTPAGNGTALRYTGESLDFAVQATQSNEIRADRQVSDLIQTGASGSGGFNFELSYKEYDTLLQAALQSTFNSFGTNGVFTPGVYAAGTAGAAVTATTITAQTGTPFTNVPVGSWIKLYRATGTVTYFALVTGVTGTILTVSAATPLAVFNTAAGDTITSLAVSNGTTQGSFSLEVGHTDINQYRLYKGFSPNKVSLSLQSGQIVTGSFDFMGMNATITGTSAMGAVVGSQTNSPMNAVTGVGTLLEGGVALTGTYMKTLSIDITNNLRGQDAIGVLGYAGIATGSVAVTGSVQVYFNDATMMNKLINNTKTSLAFYIKDSAGNAYGFNLPSVKFSSGKVNAAGLNQDTMVDLQFTAYMDATLLKTIIITKM